MNFISIESRRFVNAFQMHRLLAHPRISILERKWEDLFIYITGKPELVGFGFGWWVLGPKWLLFSFSTKTALLVCRKMGEKSIQVSGSLCNGGGDIPSEWDSSSNPYTLIFKRIQPDLLPSFYKT